MTDWLALSLARSLTHSLISVCNYYTFDAASIAGQNRVADYILETNIICHNEDMLFLQELY